MSLITVIIPNYNHAQFLQRRIESVLSQDFDDFELIILDDCSTDSSKSIIEAYRHHPKLKAIHFNDTNSGSPFLQWEKGIALAETEWIWIAESDDYCDPFFLSSLLPAFNNKNTVLAYSEIKWVNEDGELVKDAEEHDAIWFEGGDFLRQKMLFKDHLVNAGMVVFRKACVKQVTNGWQFMKQAGDYWFWCEIARQGMIYSCGKTHAYFTKHVREVSAKWLGSKRHFEEEASVLQLMLSRKVISKSDLKMRVLHELVALKCNKSGMPGDLFTDRFESWFSFQQKQGLKISHLLIRFHEYARKTKHFLRTKISYN